MKTIVWKELREQWLLPIIALAVMTTATMMACLDTGLMLNRASFLASWTMVAGVYAAILGLSQFFRDERAESRALLLHRGLSTKEIFWGKCLAGAILFSVAIVPPMIGTAIWVALNNQSQFAGYTFQLWPPALLCLMCFMAWPAGAMTLMREARLFGSRLLALPAVLVALLFCTAVISSSNYLINTLLALLLATAVLAVLLRSAQEWFVHPSHMSRSTRFGLTLINTSVVVAAALTVIVAIVENLEQRDVRRLRAMRQYSVNIDDEGRAVLVSIGMREMNSNGSRQSLMESAELNKDGDAVQRLEPNRVKTASTEISVSKPVAEYQKASGVFQYLGSLARPVYTDQDPPGELKTYEARRDRGKDREWHFVLDNLVGEILAYTESGELSHRLTPDKVNGRERFGSVAEKGHWNSGLRVRDTAAAVSPANTKSKRLVIEFDEAVYAIDNRGEVAELLAFDTTDARESRGSETLYGFARILRYQDRISVISREMMPIAGSKEVFNLDGVKYWRRDFQPPKTVRDAAITTWALRPETDRPVVVLAADVDRKWNHLLYDRDGEVAESNEYVQEIPVTSSASRYRPVLGLVPVALFTGSLGYVLLRFPEQWDAMKESIVELFFAAPQTALVVAVQLFLGVVLTWLACRYRRVAAGYTRWWVLFGLLFGPAAAVAILAVYPRIGYVTCKACGKSTRIDESNCEACSESLDHSSPLGIEIFDDETPQPQAA
ncbi:MAG: hypothetical protein Aurels2KO_01280 [Aureliella sp.]